MSIRTNSVACPARRLGLRPLLCSLNGQFELRNYANRLWSHQRMIAALALARLMERKSNLDKKHALKC